MVFARDANVSEGHRSVVALQENRSDRLLREPPDMSRGCFDLGVLVNDLPVQDHFLEAGVLDFLAVCSEAGGAERHVERLPLASGGGRR